MKRMGILIFLLGTLMALYSISAQATTGTVTAGGFYDIGSETGVTISAGGTSVEKVFADVNGDDQYEALYSGSDMLSVSCSGTAAGGEYLILLTTGSSLPTKSAEICYIDQVTATASTVTFTVKSELLPTECKDLTLFITGSKGFTTKAVSLGYAPDKSSGYPVAPYTLGDVDDDGRWTSTDALKTLQFGAGLLAYTPSQWSAADVTGDGNVNAIDALKILQYGAGLITSFH